jgi:hypothetical protein
MSDLSEANLRFKMPSGQDAAEAERELNRLGIAGVAFDNWVNVWLEGLCPNALSALARWATESSLVCGVNYYVHRGTLGGQTPTGAVSWDDVNQMAHDHSSDPVRTRRTPLAALIQDFVSLAARATQTAETAKSLSEALDAAQAELQLTRTRLATADDRCKQLARDRNRARSVLKDVRRAASARW